MLIIEKVLKNKSFQNDKSEIQKDCINALLRNPFPSKKNEKWRLTDKNKLSEFLNFKLDNGIATNNNLLKNSSNNILKLTIGENQFKDLIEKTWSIQTLSEEELDKIITNDLTDSNPEDNWSKLLNHSLSYQNNILGLKIKGEEIPPIEILTESNSGFLSAKTLILLIEKNSKVNILNLNLGAKNSSLSLATHIELENNAEMNYGSVSLGSKGSNILHSLTVNQEKNSNLNLGSLQFQFEFGRFELSINQKNGEAKTQIKGMQISKNREQLCTFSEIKFNGPNGFLDQINKSLACDSSHAIFEGAILVPKIAQKTDASQLSRNLLLSKYATIDTKPQLEIVADDVKCKHGATVTQLNNEELFYMRSRGLTLEEASKLQLKSYYQEIISFLPAHAEHLNLLDYLLNEK